MSQGHQCQVEQGEIETGCAGSRYKCIYKTGTVRARIYEYLKILLRSLRAGARAGRWPGSGVTSSEGCQEARGLQSPGQTKGGRPSFGAGPNGWLHEELRPTFWVPIM